jgi:hypothetical protein
MDGLGWLLVAGLSMLKKLELQLDYLNFLPDVHRFTRKKSPVKVKLDRSWKK